MTTSFDTPSPWTSRQSTAWAIGAGLLCGAIGALMEGAFVYAMLRSNGSADSWLFTLGRTLPPWLLFAAAAPLFAWLARRFSFERPNLRASIVVHVLVSVVAALLHLAAFSLTYVLMKDQMTWARFTHILTISVRYLFLVEVLTYWSIIGIYLTVHFSNLRRSLAEARLIALRTQLNPHFLFNSLHAISTMSLRGEHREVAEMLGRLSDLLRAALDGRRQEVPLGDELEFIEHYISLQRIRYGERLNVEHRVSAQALKGLIPTMILQPLVENAIRHGISVQREGGTVRIVASVDRDHLHVAVEDTGPGFDSENVRPGIGLSNTSARLEQLYGANHRFECARGAEGGAAVRLSVPFRTTAHDSAVVLDAQIGQPAHQN